VATFDIVKTRKGWWGNTKGAYQICKGDIPIAVAIDRPTAEKIVELLKGEQQKTTECGFTPGFGGPCILEFGHTGPHDDGCNCDLTFQVPIYRQDCPLHGHKVVGEVADDS
jgi:hypothetical protein